MKISVIYTVPVLYDTVLILYDTVLLNFQCLIHKHTDTHTYYSMFY